MKTDHVPVSISAGEAAIEWMVAQLPPEDSKRLTIERPPRNSGARISAAEAAVQSAVAQSELKAELAEQLKKLLEVAKDKITELLNEKDICWQDWDESYEIDYLIRPTSYYINRIMTFDIIDPPSELKDRVGHKVTVIRELYDNERDWMVGRIFDVMDMTDGFIFQAFDFEIKDTE